MSGPSAGGLYFLHPGVITNGAKYLNLFKHKLNIHVAVHDCNIFMHDDAPCHRSRLVKNYVHEKKMLMCWIGRETVRIQIQFETCGM